MAKLPLLGLNTENISGATALYIGRDIGIWQKIQGRLPALYPHKPLNFFHVSSSVSKDYQKLFTEIVSFSPTIIYIDFSDAFQEHIRLSVLIGRENALKQSVTAGLFENREQTKAARGSGLSFMFIKGDDLHDCIYGPMSLAFPDTSSSAKFAKAVFKHEAELISDFRVGVVQESRLHVEGHLPLKLTDEIIFKTKISEGMVPSRRFTVSGINTENLYYDYNYSYELDFKFVELPHVKPPLDEETGKVIQEEFDDLKRRAKKKYEKDLLSARQDLKQWILDVGKSTTPKKTKILIIDPLSSIYSQAPQELDSYPYTFRTQSFLSKNLKEVDKVLPHVIIYQFPNHAFEVQDSKTTLKKEFVADANALFQKIARKEGYLPFLAFFNSKKFTSSYFQESFSYSQIIANPDALDFTTLLQMAEIFQNKLNEKDEALEKEKKEAKDKTEAPLSYYVPKKSPYSFGSTSIEVGLKSLSESEITFIAPIQLHQGTYRLKFPFEMSVTLVEVDGRIGIKADKGLLYKGIINCIDESDKKELRRWVNRIIGGELDEDENEEENASNEKKETPEDAAS